MYFSYIWNTVFYLNCEVKYIKTHLRGNKVQQHGETAFFIQVTNLSRGKVKSSSPADCGKNEATKMWLYSEWLQLLICLQLVSSWSTFTEPPELQTTQHPVILQPLLSQLTTVKSVFKFRTVQMIPAPWHEVSNSTSSLLTVPGVRGQPGGPTRLKSANNEPIKTTTWFLPCFVFHRFPLIERLGYLLDKGKLMFALLRDLRPREAAEASVIQEMSQRYKCSKWQVIKFKI